MQFEDNDYTAVYWFESPLKERSDCAKAVSITVPVLLSSFPEVEAHPGAALPTESSVPLVTMSASSDGLMCTLSRTRFEVRMEATQDKKVEFAKFIAIIESICGSLLSTLCIQFPWNRLALLRNRIATGNASPFEIASQFIRSDNAALGVASKESFVIAMHRTESISGIEEVNVWFKCRSVLRTTDDSPTALVEHDINSAVLPTNIKLDEIMSFSNAAIAVSDKDLANLLSN